MLCSKARLLMELAVPFLGQKPLLKGEAEVVVVSPAEISELRHPSD